MAGKTWKSNAGAPGDSFQASEGGRRTVATNWKPAGDDDEGEKKMGDLTIGDGEGEDKKEEDEEGQQEVSASPVEEKSAVQAIPEPEVKTKGRVVFIYSCPSGSPVKLRMVYSTSVRGVQMDATDKAGVEIVGKVSPCTSIIVKIYDRC